MVATGPGGTAWSPDEGERPWKLLPDLKGFWAVAFANREAGWLVGTEGRIIKISFNNAGNSGDDDSDEENHAN